MAGRCDPVVIRRVSRYLRNNRCWLTPGAMHHADVLTISTSCNRETPLLIAVNVNRLVCKAYITIAIRLQHHYDTTIPRRIRLRRK